MESHELNLVTADALTTIEAPVPMAHQAVHDSVVSILQELPRGELLDVPAGEGALAASLDRMGFAVRCCDLYPEIFRLPNIEMRQGDLSTSLPYSDREFDYVTCVEGLEHIENPQQAIREFARLLRPGGHLVTSVPNILNIEERLKWLFFGYTSHFKPITRASVQHVRKEFDGKVEVALHVNPIGYSELRYTLEECGFAIVSLYRDKRKSRMWIYWPIVALIRTISRLAPAARRRERWADELISDEILQGGNTLIVHASKV